MAESIECDPVRARFAGLIVDDTQAERAAETELSPRVRRMLETAVRDAVEDATHPNSAVRIAYTAPLRDGVLYRTTQNVVGPGLVICQRCLRELAAYRFAGKALHVAALGVRERLHALVQPACGLCDAAVAVGNRCYNELCGTPLHPRWPAVYCSDECALEDR